MVVKVFLIFFEFGMETYVWYFTSFSCTIDEEMAIGCSPVCEAACSFLCSSIWSACFFVSPVSDCSWGHCVWKALSGAGAISERLGIHCPGAPNMWPLVRTPGIFLGLLTGPTVCRCKKKLFLDCHMVWWIKKIGSESKEKNRTLAVTK